MTHTRLMSDSEGSFTPPVETTFKCPRCGSPIKHQTWDSSCGSYEDTKYSCSNPTCDYVRWVDGIDS